jgi:hypothetical protein
LQIKFKEKKMRIIVNDYPGTEHADGVRQAIIYGYNATYDKNSYPDVDMSSEVAVVSGAFQDVVNYAKTDKNIIAIARSMSGIKYCIESAKLVYPRVQSFIPMGSNVYYEMKIFTDPEPPLIATCGCGDDENRNNTAYGNGLEFWDTDWCWEGGTDASSYANGWVCGKIWRIYDELRKIYGNNATWWWARWLAREFAWREESNRPKDEFGNPVKWCKENGYGHINLDESLRHMQLTPPIDPYMALVELGPIGKVTGTPMGAVKIKLEPVKNAIQYNIIKNGSILKMIKAGEPLEYTDVLTIYGTYYYSYYAVGATGQTVESSKIRVLYTKGNHPSIIYLRQEQIKDME